MDTQPVKTTVSGDSLNFRRLLPVLLVVLVDVMGLTIIIPVLPFYALAFDATPLMIGLLVSSYPLMQFMFVPILGALSDRIGRKPVLAAAQMGTFSSLLILAFSGSIWMIFLSRILDGITGANLATAQSVITDSTSSQNRAKGLGLIGATFGIGFVLGPVLSGIALRLSGNNYAAPALVAAGFALVSVLLTTFMLEETLPAGQRQSAPARESNLGRLVRGLQDPNLGSLFIIILCLQIIFGGFQATFAPFTLNRLGLNSFGNTIFFASFGITLAFIQGALVGPLTKRLGERGMILVGLTLFSLGFLLSSFTPQQAVPWYSERSMIAELSQQSGNVLDEGSSQLGLLPPEENTGIGALVFLLFALLPMPIGFGILQPAVNSLVTKVADPRKIGEALGLAAAFTAAGTAIGPLLGGAIFDFWGPTAVYVINGIAGIGVLFLALQRLQPAQKQTRAPIPFDETIQVNESGD